MGSSHSILWAIAGRSSVEPSPWDEEGEVFHAAEVDVRQLGTSLAFVLWSFLGAVHRFLALLGWDRTRWEAFGTEAMRAIFRVMEEATPLRAPSGQ